EPMHPAEVLSLLQEGNERFVKGTSLAVRRNDVVRREFVDLNQAPHAAIVGCSDCQAPLETIFDSLPGDIFAFKNAGNTCIHANGSMVASLEFCTAQLGCRFILVLGHKRCGVLLDACKTHAEHKHSGCGDCALNGLLHDMSSVIDQAAELASNVSLLSGDGKSLDDIVKLAEKAVEVNVFQTLELLLRFS
ncbi:mtcA2, partial [Symbiodinium pilosum]